MISPFLITMPGFYGQQGWLDDLELYASMRGESAEKILLDLLIENFGSAKEKGALMLGELPEDSFMPYFDSQQQVYALPGRLVQILQAAQATLGMSIEAMIMEAIIKANPCPACAVAN